MLKENQIYGNLKNNLSGLIFDSCPGQRTMTSFYHAMVDHVLEGNKVNKQIRLIQYALN